jgi:hypothetical protein
MHWRGPNGSNAPTGLYRRRFSPGLECSCLRRLLGGARRPHLARRALTNYSSSYEGSDPPCLMHWRGPNADDTTIHTHTLDGGEAAIRSALRSPLLHCIRFSSQPLQIQSPHPQPCTLPADHTRHAAPRCLACVSGRRWRASDLAEQARCAHEWSNQSSRCLLCPARRLWEPFCCLSLHEPVPTAAAGKSDCWLWRTCGGAGRQSATCIGALCASTIPGLATQARTRRAAGRFWLP